MFAKTDCIIHLPSLLGHFRNSQFITHSLNYFHSVNYKTKYRWTKPVMYVVLISYAGSYTLIQHHLTASTKIDHICFLSFEFIKSHNKSVMCWCYKWQQYCTTTTTHFFPHQLRMPACLAFWGNIDVSQAIQ